MDGFRAEVSHALHTGRTWVSGLHCDCRWNMGFSPHFWIQATVTAMAPYTFPKNQKTQNFNLSEKKKSLRPFSGTEKLFSWSTSCLLAQQLMPLHTDTLTRLQWAIQNKRRGLLSRSMCLLHDNMRPHSAHVTTARLEKFKWDILDHPQYSPDRVPSDFHLFLHLNKQLEITMKKCKINSWRGSKGRRQTSMAQEYRSWFQDNKCLDNAGNYVEK